MLKVAAMAPQIVLAPLRGVTDAIFRTTYAEHFSGIDWAVAPFLSTTKGSRIKPGYLKELLPENNPHMPIMPQIMSKTADKFLVLVNALSDLGFEVVNWNLGCPYPMVAKKGRGSGLLPHPDIIEGFLERVSAILPHRLSIKLRLGRHDSQEIDALLPIFNQYPLKEIIIHPRTGVQMYDGCPDLEAFDRCLELSNHPVMYNGDIVRPNDYHALQARFVRVDTWMIGRGAVSNPFLPGQIKGNTYSRSERNAIFIDFHDQLFKRYQHKLFGPSHLISRMKGLWGYFAKAFKEGPKLRKKINKAQNPQRFTDVIARFFDDDPQWITHAPDRVACNDDEKWIDPFRHDTQVGI